MSAEYRHVEPMENFAKPQIPFVLLPYCIHSKETSFVFVIKNAFQHLLLLLIGYKKAITIANSINRATTLSHLTSIFHYQCSEKKSRSFHLSQWPKPRKDILTRMSHVPLQCCVGRWMQGLFKPKKRSHAVCGSLRHCSIFFSRISISFFLAKLIFFLSLAQCI